MYIISVTIIAHPGYFKKLSMVLVSSKLSNDNTAKVNLSDPSKLLRMTSGSASKRLSKWGNFDLFWSIPSIIMLIQSLLHL